jgi:hypothetical protein
MSHSHANSQEDPTRASYIQTRSELQSHIEALVSRAQRDIISRIDTVLVGLRDDKNISPGRRAHGLDVVRVLQEDLEENNRKIAALRTELTERERAFARYEAAQRREKAAEAVRKAQSWAGR